ncbi:MAG: hypothetical protein CMB64_04720 [Euryarchaeota archaeon]|nr:hypothetical protein [Euryarchaeota archaeon]
MASFSLSLPTALNSGQALGGTDPPAALNETIQNKFVETTAEQLPGVSIQSIAADSTVVEGKAINPLDLINERITEIEKKLNIILSELYGPTRNLDDVLILDTTNYPSFIPPSGEGLRKVVRGSSTGFSNDSEITVSSHFSILNPENMTKAELTVVTDEIKNTFATQAGVTPDNVVIVELEPTGSSTAQIKVIYPENTENLHSKKNSFQQFLSDPENVSSVLESVVGPSQILSVSESRKKSVDAKLNELQRRLTTEFTLDHRSNFQLSNFKFEVLEDKLFINRFDDDQEIFVGAELILD